MAKASEKEEDAQLEVEAAQAVYGDDCRVVSAFPPHLVLHVRPRTADDSSIQFVEMCLGIKATTEYPEEPPYVYAIEAKGLDDNRQSQIINRLQEFSRKQSFGPVIGVLCEEAVEILSNMNHPEGDCPLCLYPLVMENANDNALPFMKLMSCYHCFHSSCILRWWMFSQSQSTAEPSGSKTTPVAHGLRASVNQQSGICPVCRKMFDEKDIEHVLALLGASALGLGTSETGHDDDVQELLHSDIETDRRRHFDELLQLQEKQNGIIEPKKELIVQPGMYVSLPQPVHDDAGESSGKPGEGSTSTAPPMILEGEPGSSIDDRVAADKIKKTGRKHRARGSKKQHHQHPHSAKSQWIERQARSFDQ